MSYVVYAPLEYFYWSGSDLHFGPDLWLRRLPNPPDMHRFSDQLSADEWNRVREASHWIVFDWDDQSELRPVEIGTLVLLSLWIIRRTRTHIAFRFQIEEETGNQTIRTRLLDRFAWTDDIIDDSFTDDQLHEASVLYSALADICIRRGRLNNAILLTAGGCWSHLWHSAFICHAGALETLLTYSKERGVTHRIAATFACITEHDNARRDAAFREFSYLYSIRSDIVHGRAHTVPVSDHAPTLIRFQSALRQLWRTIAGSPELIAALEKSDDERKPHLLALHGEYRPPKV